MKNLIIAIALAAGLVAQADHCDHHLIATHARYLANASHQMETAVNQTVGYQHLTQDVYAVERDAEQLAYLATSGSACHTLRQQFDYITYGIRNLEHQYNQTQSVHPNAHIAHYWNREVNAYRQLSHAVTSGGGATTQVQLNCSSSQYKYQACGVNGRIITARLTQQISSSSCQQGRTWGFAQN